MPSHTDKDGDNRLEIHLRLWPALAVLVAQFTSSWILSLLGSTTVHSIVIHTVLPLTAAVLLAIWWLAVSRAPVIDRVLGIPIIVAALWFIGYSCGDLLLAFAVPAMTTGTVLTLAATTRLRWSQVRWALAVFIAACTGVFAVLRADEVGGGLAPVVSWRWSPTRIEASAAVPTTKANRTATLPAQAGPGDWSGFRGSVRDGIVTGTRFSTDWSTPPRELWRRKVGSGWSSFAAIDGYLFTQEQRGAEELVTCYEAATGAEVWTNRTEAQFMDDSGLGPRATPTFCGGRLYTQGCAGMLQCLDAATGNTIWRHDLAKDPDTLMPGNGFAGSPLVTEDRKSVV